jgi:hypothetical protein
MINLGPVHSLHILLAQGEYVIFDQGALVTIWRRVTLYSNNSSPPATPLDSTRRSARQGHPANLWWVSLVAAGAQGEYVRFGW